MYSEKKKIIEKIDNIFLFFLLQNYKINRDLKKKFLNI